MYCIVCEIILSVLMYSRKVLVRLEDQFTSLSLSVSLSKTSLKTGFKRAAKSQGLSCYMVDAAVCITGSMVDRIKQAKHETHGTKQFMKRLPAIFCGNGTLLIRIGLRVTAIGGHNPLGQNPLIQVFGWLGGSVVERRSLTGELSLVCTGPAADG